ncbi:AAA family ATPase [Nostoc sp. UHCC 0702]|nr:AAA family ATPase [Nostoc sp. UHCC 0702]
MSHASLPTNPFSTGGKIEDTRLFIGRTEELHAIAAGMQNVQPTNINIVGDKHIGKSWLLYYFFLTWEQRVSDRNRYIVVYLSLRNANCQTEAGFYQAVADALQSRLGALQFNLKNPLRTKPLNRQAFSNAIKQWKQQKVLPVLCLDDFDRLFRHAQEFDDGFYDNLRSLMEDNALMLVLASGKSLNVYGSEYRFVSSFFNIAHTVELKELTTDEAMQLTRLPISSVNNTPALSVDEQHQAQQWGKRHPHKLQLAGYYLWEARQQGKDIKWAKQKFAQQIADSQPQRKKLGWKSFLGWLWDIPLHLGRLATKIGGNWDDVQNRIIGMLILVVIGLGLVRVLPLPDVKQWLERIFNFVK